MDGDAFILDDDTQMVSQNLESMSLSALKILIEAARWKMVHYLYENALYAMKWDIGTPSFTHY